MFLNASAADILTRKGTCIIDNIKYVSGLFECTGKPAKMEFIHHSFHYLSPVFFQLSLGFVKCV